MDRTIEQKHVQVNYLAFPSTGIVAPIAGEDLVVNTVYVHQVVKVYFRFGRVERTVSAVVVAAECVTR